MGHGLHLEGGKRGAIEQRGVKITIGGRETQGVKQTDSIVYGNPHFIGLNSK